MRPSIESPMVEPLRAIGVDKRAIPGILHKYPVRLLQEWVDITLAAEERFGRTFFKRSPRMRRGYQRPEQGPTDLGYMHKEKL